MDHKGLSGLSTDNNFSRLIQPYTEKEINELKYQLYEKKEKQEILIWNGKHLNDGHIYDICNEIGIEIELKNFSFTNYQYAAIYICEKQLLRKDLTNEYKKYLIGKKFNYSYEIKNRGVVKEPPSKTKLASIIGDKVFLSSGTVIKYAVYAEAIDCIFDGDESFAREILLGHILVSHENVIELSRIKNDEIKAVGNSVRKNKIVHLTFSDIRLGIKTRYLKERGVVSRSEKKYAKLSENAGIRQMPVFDPDSEVNSLCMTIGSWISSIQRVNNTVDFSRITAKARIKLVKELSYLERTVNNIQESLIVRGNHDG